MKTLFVALLALVLFVLLLRSEVTPWRIVRAEDLERPSQPSQPSQPTRVLIPVTRPRDHSGDWMRDPRYRTALEKTTAAGRPEQAGEHDASQPAPSPGR